MPQLIVSFDAIGTLIRFKGGVGYQYLTALRQFVDAATSEHHSNSSSTSPPRAAAASGSLSNEGAARRMPRVTEDVALMEKVAWDAIRAELRQDRTVWVAELQGKAKENSLSTQKVDAAEKAKKGGEGRPPSQPDAHDVAVNPKEMPIGGTTDASVSDFWFRVLRRSFRDERIWDLPEDIQATLHGSPTAFETAIAPPEAWAALYDHVAEGIYGSDKGYEWLPEGKRTLAMLTAIITQDSGTIPAVGHGSSSAAPPLRIVSLPVVLSNSDRRIAHVLTLLGATIVPVDPPREGHTNGSEKSGSPSLLLAGVLAAMDVGRAKPSPLGIIKCREMMMQRAANRADAKDIIHIHVGDTEEDRLACEAATRLQHPCHYLACDPTVGVRWEDLLAKALFLAQQQHL